MFTNIRRRPRAAFTLVELLVVIGIIALLISILLPSLSKARESAKRVTCGNQLRQIAIGAINYANDFKGFWPQNAGVSSDGSNTGTTTFNSLDTMYIHWTLANKEDVYANVGRLVHTEYLTAPYIKVQGQDAVKIYFCPGQDPEQVASGANLRGSYNFNPHWKWGDANKTIRTTWYEKMTDMPNDEVLVCDSIYDYGNIAHRDSAQGAYWNLCFKDGHVQEVKDTVIAKQILTRGGSGTPNTFARFDDYLEGLRMESQGLTLPNPPTNLVPNHPVP